MSYVEPKLSPEERKLSDFSRLPTTGKQRVIDGADGRVTLPIEKSVPAPATHTEWAGELERKG